MSNEASPVEQNAIESSLPNSSQPLIEPDIDHTTEDAAPPPSNSEEPTNTAPATTTTTTTQEHVTDSGSNVARAAVAATETTQTQENATDEIEELPPKLERLIAHLSHLDKPRGKSSGNNQRSRFSYSKSGLLHLTTSGATTTFIKNSAVAFGQIQLPLLFLFRAK